jgi:methylase of polypeptide subunit release factors
MSAARVAARVVATDLNPVSVACARMNVLNNGLAGRIEVYVGDMFEPVAGERFDLILCNPPYFRGNPRTDAELAYKAGESFEWMTRFAHEAPNFLADGGSVACVFGGAAELQTILLIFTEEGWSGRLVAQKYVFAEKLLIWQFRRKGRKPKVESPSPQVTSDLRHFQSDDNDSTL